MYPSNNVSSIILIKFALEGRGLFGLFEIDKDLEVLSLGVIALSVYL